MRRTLAVVALLTGTLVASLTGAAPAGAATQIGHDISWPQCTVRQGGYGNPMPPASTGFVVLGLTRGLPFTTNPCLIAQARWVRNHHRPFHAYTMAAYPTRAQLARYGSRGPYPATSVVDRLRNVGYAEATYAIRTLRSIGLRPPRIWIDVEKRTRQRWPDGAANARYAAYNRAVLDGMLAAFARSRIPAGFYSNSDGWATITAGWQRSTVPFWATVGTRGRATALRRCGSRGLNGGPVHLVQWWDSTPMDYDVACPGYTLASPEVALDWPAVSSTRSRFGRTGVVLTAAPRRRQTWRLTVVDACTGRLVARTGGVTADRIVARWNGRAANARPAPAGVYRLTLQTGNGTPPTGPSYAPIHQVLTSSGEAVTCLRPRRLV